MFSCWWAWPTREGDSVLLEAVGWGGVTAEVQSLKQTEDPGTAAGQVFVRSWGSSSFTNARELGTGGFLFSRFIFLLTNEVRS